MRKQLTRLIAMGVALYAWGATPFLPRVEAGTCTTTVCGTGVVGSGTQIGGNLPADAEGSGAVWHERLGHLFIVSDTGKLYELEPPATGTAWTLLHSWNVGGDLEGVCVADSDTDFIYLGIEHPDGIKEFNLTTGAVTRTFTLTTWMTGADNSGLEALEFVPVPGHPEGGYFVAGLQANGQLHLFQVPIATSTTSTTVIYKGTLPSGYTWDISGLHYDRAHRILYTLSDSANKLKARQWVAGADPTQAGAWTSLVVNQAQALDYWVLSSGGDQEGIAIVGPTPAAYTIEALAESGGTITPAGTVRVESEAPSTLFIADDRGPSVYRYDLQECRFICPTDRIFAIASDPTCTIDEVLVDGGSVGAVSSYTFPPLSADHAIQAQFRPTTVVLTINTVEQGSVTAVPVPLDPLASTYAPGTIVTLTAEPADGFHFMEWSGDLIGVANPTVVTVDRDTSVLATFAVDGHMITASAGVNGAISPSGSVPIAHGASQTFTMLPAPNYKVAKVYVDDVSKGNITSFTFSNVTADHTISVTFAKMSYKIITATAVAGGGQLISRFGVSAPAPGVATATFTGAAGAYTIRVWYFDESDGISQYALKKNGQLLASWAADQNLGSAALDANTLTSKTVGPVTLAEGDLLRLEVTGNRGDYGRTDRLELIPS